MRLRIPALAVCRGVPRDHSMPERFRGAPFRWGIVAGLASLILAFAGCGTGAGPATTTQGSANSRTNLGGGISVHYGHGWHLIAPGKSVRSNPNDRLLLTSYPTTAAADNCGFPFRAEQDLQANGALIYLFEYRPPRGAVWANLRRADFPPRPAHFALHPHDLANYECWRVPSYRITFRAAGRPFQLHVALGKRATAAYRAQVLRTLDSLRFSPLPPPPPDPYGGWGWLSNETGDSIRTPPHWPAGGNALPRRYPRPRALFFANNLPLPGLARRRAPGEHRLPTPFPAGALDAFPENGVLLWVLEEPKGPASNAFPPLPHRRWPHAGDFQLVQTGPARRWPQLRWERAAGEETRHRFSVWVISGTSATDRDRALAGKAAAALALSSGGFRDAPCRRACKTGRAPGT